MTSKNHMDKHGEYCSRLINYRSDFDEYSIPDYAHYPGDASAPKQLIYFCPWCGERLPESSRDKWYDELEALGLDPNVDEIPQKYKTDEWRK
jgi:hypothetical protein